MESSTTGIDGGVRQNCQYQIKVISDHWRWLTVVLGTDHQHVMNLRYLRKTVVWITISAAYTGFGFLRFVSGLDSNRSFVIQYQRFYN